MVKIVSNNKQKPNLKAIKPSKTSFEHSINCYDGCQHGCLYCYARKIRYKDYDTWIQAKPRTTILDLLQRDIQDINPQTKPSIKDIFVCSACDAYQPLEIQHGITRSVIKILIENDLPFTVLTKSSNVLRDIDLFKGYDKCRVGLTIITLDDDFRKKLEPNASPIADRCDALETLKANGVSTYCSVEPIMSCKESDPIEIIERLKNCVDLFEFGKWSPYVQEGIPVVYDEKYYLELFSKLIPYCEQETIKYCIAGHSIDFLITRRAEFHGLCPWVNEKAAM